MQVNLSTPLPASKASVAVSPPRNNPPTVSVGFGDPLHECLRCGRMLTRSDQRAAQQGGPQLCAACIDHLDLYGRANGDGGIRR